MKYLFSILTLFTFLIGNSQVLPPAGIGNNMILWLSPDSAVYKTPGNLAATGDRIEEWHDISGGGFVFTTQSNATRPKYVNYQGRNMLDFTGGDLLENTAIASIINGLSEFSIYIVIKSDNKDTDNGFLDSKNPNGADEILGMRYDKNGANTGRVKLLKCGMQGNTPNNQVESQSNTQTKELQVLTLTWKAGEKINLYIDGVLNESSANSISTNMNSVQKILLGKGAKNTAANSGWDGRIGTTIFYNVKMSPDSVSLISGDLKAINSVQTGNWNDPNTWDCNCDPPNNSFVKINSNHTVTLTKNETVTNIIIEPQGSLDLSTNNWRLNVKRNFTNNGTLSSRNGKIKFIGTQEQLINGAATTDFYNLHVNNSSGVRVINGNVNIQGSLYLQSGCFNTGNRVTLISNAIRTARIAELTGSTCITGDITMQRYINAGATNWRFLTSAIAGSTIADFNDDFITSGFTGSDFPLWPTAANPWASIYFYDETQPGAIDSGFVAVSNVSNSLTVGEGIWAWSGDTITGTQPFTLDMTGPVNTGNINLPITYTNSGSSIDDGWNMVGNPYPSTIDWDDPSITKNAVNNAIYIWNPDLQQFASYISPFGTNGGSKYIASSQAFWIQASGSGAAVQLTETCKTADGGTFLKQGNPAPLIIDVTNSTGTDQTIINFEPLSTIGFDPLFDATKMTSVATNVPSVSTLMLDSINLSINQLHEQEINIPLKIITGASGLHQIDFTGISNFSFAGCLILEDLFTGSVYDLTSTSSITAFIYDTTQTARFLIKFGARVDITSTNISCYGNNDGNILFEKNSPNSFDVIWKDNLGNIVANNSNVSVSDGITNLSGGIFTIETTDNTCGNRIDTVVITEPNQIMSQFITNTDTVYLSNGGNITFINQSTNANYYQWDFDDLSTSNQSSPTHQYTQAGNYLVSLDAFQNANCFESFSKTITVLNMSTEIDEENLEPKSKAWINSNYLTIESVKIDKIEIRNVLGQTLFLSNIKEDYQTFNLETLSSQIFVITIYSKDQTSSFKVNYIKN